MLSRLASAGSRTAARSMSARTLAAFPSVKREFNSSATLRNAAPAASSSADMDPADIVQKYGSTAFWGGLAAIMVSKEVFILNAEWLLSMEIAAFVMTGYVLTGDTIDKMSREQDQAKTDKFNDANDFMLEMFNQYKVVQEASQNKPAVMQQYLEEYKNSIVEHAKYQTVVPKHAARASVLAALEGIKAREEHAAAMEWQQTVDTAVANVTKAFTSGDDKLMGETLELAINNLGTEPADDQIDPVKRLFLAEFEE